MKEVLFFKEIKNFFFNLLKTKEAEKVYVEEIDLDKKCYNEKKENMDEYVNYYNSLTRWQNI